MTALAVSALAACDGDTTIAGLDPPVPGALTVTVDGLPGGAPADLTLTGPGSGGSSRHLTGSGTVSNLTPGSYTLTAASVAAAGDGYRPVPETQLISVHEGPAATDVSISYQIVTGRIALSVEGLPPGSGGSVVITGPDGFSATRAQSDTLVGLAPGNYAVLAQPVSLDGDAYQPVAGSQVILVNAGAIPTPVTAAYQLITGRLQIDVRGVPDGVVALVNIAGTGGYDTTISATTTLTGLAPGSYQVAAQSISVGGVRYDPAVLPATVSVSAVLEPSTSVVAYAKATGDLQVQIAGLPGGVPAAVTITGPGGFHQPITQSTLLSALETGVYDIAAATVSVGGTLYAPVPGSQSVTVVAGATASASMSYGPAAGSLAISVSGLPGGVAAHLAIAGPGGYGAIVTATQTLSGLTPGSYTIDAQSVVSGGTTYDAAPTSQTVTVPSGGSTNASVSYTGVPTVALNLSINGLYLTQAVQRYDGSAPLVAGRDAYLRVFVVANQANSATPSVRVRFYSNGALTQTSTIAAPSPSVPIAVTEGVLASSWNLAVPAALVQPNLTILADVDPANAVAEANEADNVFPVSGTPGAVDVRVLPTFKVRFVPVHQDSTGLTGNVSSGNQATFLADPRTLLPIGGFAADVRAVYTTNAPPLQSSNGNGAWGTILYELLALKRADGSAQYYYGVAGTTYSSGVAGIGYVGGGATTALGWDRLPSASGVMAHELGHNMGRSHAPCGSVGYADPSYPYSGAKIGVYGLDLTTLAIKSPSIYVDLMGYCNPAWVSDYNWTALVQYRQGGPDNVPSAAVAGIPTDGLLVFGRATSKGLTLEPAFPVAAPVSGLDPASGYAVEGLTIDGRVVFRFGVSVVRALDDRGSEELHFAAVLPVDAATRSQIAGLRLIAPGRSTVRYSAQALAARARQLFLGDPVASLTRPNPAQAELRWDGATYPMALVRDVRTGEILSFARGGRIRLWAPTDQMTVIFSDGIHTVERQVR